MSAPTESRPWGDPSIDARSSFTRCVAVRVGDILLWGNPSRETSPCRPSRAPLRCDPDRRSSRTASSRCSVPPYIPSAKGGGSCARGLAVGGGTHVSSGGGGTPPNAAAGLRWRSAYIRFVTPLIRISLRVQKPFHRLIFLVIFLHESCFKVNVPVIGILVLVIGTQIILHFII